MSKPRETEWARRTRRERERAEHTERTGGTCDLCGAKPGTKGLCASVLKSALHQDHDHGTGSTRGYICGRSNRVLWPWVTSAWLRRAADYLDAVTGGSAALSDSGSGSGGGQ